MAKMGLGIRPLAVVAHLDYLGLGATGMAAVAYGSYGGGDGYDPWTPHYLSKHGVGGGSLRGRFSVGGTAPGSHVELPLPPCLCAAVYISYR